MPDKLSDSAAEAVDSSLPPLPVPPPRLTVALIEAHGEACEALALADPVKAVHGVRKGFKRLRALLRLAGTAREREVAHLARASRRALAHTARHLAQARDAAAREDALDDLVAKVGLAPTIRRAAGRAFAKPGIDAPGIDAPGASAPDGGVGAHRAALDAQMDALGKALPRLGAGLDDKALITALVAGYAKARRAGRDVDPQDDESLHELRKEVVAQRYQMELVVFAWPALGHIWVDQLQRLRDKLGKHHDLSVLRALAEAHPVRADGKPLWRTQLLAAIEARQEKLALSALLLYARLFAEKPMAFRRRLSAYMSAVSERK
ncbi:CHAD domain-containing protein [Ancylobacter aquaticus]|uniref:CHAD domain-containing protein n=1 Tax=Ancylobacter aquaticus TaxID=100 RepID=A0A4R1H887_ANCAQ|nr:CHAD domain-containing protein [Ancylobacter aquaticus]TCK16701.1 CHAD domain-containing protein [Ancylobacter aquaticus]